MWSPTGGVVSDVQVSGFITIKWIIHFSNGFCLVLNRYNRTKPGDVIMTIRLRRVAKAQIAIFTLKLWKETACWRYNVSLKTTTAFFYWAYFYFGELCPCLQWYSNPGESVRALSYAPLKARLLVTDCCHFNAQRPPVHPWVCRSHSEVWSGALMANCYLE